MPSYQRPCECGGTNHKTRANRLCPLNRNNITSEQITIVSSVLIPRSNNVIHDQQTLINTAITNQSSVSIHAPNTIRTRPVERLDIGEMSAVCEFCGALMWLKEKSGGTINSPRFNMCCKQGTVYLRQLPPTDPLMASLLKGEHVLSSEFKTNIRKYNSNLSFTSVGKQPDPHYANNNHGAYCFRIQGEFYHLIGSLYPNQEQENPVFSQVYIYDASEQVQHRMQNAHYLDENLLRFLQNHILMVSPYARQLFNMNQIIQSNDQNIDDIQLLFRSESRTPDRRRYNAPTTSEVAALLIDNDPNVTSRDIIIRPRNANGALSRISEMNQSYDPLQYVLMFPEGDIGWHYGIEKRILSQYPENEPTTDIIYPGNQGVQTVASTTAHTDDDDVMEGASDTEEATMTRVERKNVSVKMYYAYRLMYRANENGGNCLHLFGRLFQQYVVDMFCKMEQNRLNYIRFNQGRLRAELYNQVVSSLRPGDTDMSNIGRAVILPSSYTGGPRNYSQYYQDALSISRRLGGPHLFITMTTNPNWPEITRELLYSQRPSDRPDLVARVFKLKFDELMKDLTKNYVLGRTIGHVYSVEWQKRGLIHSHILINLIPEDVPTTAEQCDQLISAEIPDKEGNPELFETVVSTMLHTKCDGSVRRPLGCKQDSDVCSKSFPKPAALETQLDVGGFPSYRRRCLRTFRKDGTDYDDQWVVPYNPYLSQKYNCHINVELCVTIQAIKYLYKYVYKGNDRAQVDIAPENGNSTHEPVRDEIKQFVDARYVCPPEAMWHILGFKIHHEYPKHIRLQVHLEDEQLIYFKNSADPTTIQQRPARSTTLTSWFTYNRESNDETSRSLLYPDFPRKYTFDNNHKVWRPRRRDIDSTLGRMHYVPILKGETYYLRMLLNKIPGATCYEDMRTVRRTVHRSFKEAAIALGLLQSDNDLSLAIAEAATYSMHSQLRRLFCSLIVFCEPTSIADLWITHRFVLSEDYLYQYNLNMDPAHRLQEPTESMYGMALLDLEDELAQHSRSIKGTEGIDFPVVDLRPTTLVLDERFTDSRILRDHGSLITSARELPPIDPQEFNASQLMVFDRIIAAIDGSPLQAKVFFVDGPGGTGKTFLFSKLLQYVRQSNNIAIAVASSGAAATLLPGGRTAHSTFGIPLKVTSSSSITLKPRSQIADVIRRANIIVWDECSMIDINAFEFVDRTLKDIMKQNDPLREHVPFGGKLIAFGGDFRQVLPVVRTAGRSVIVSHCINRSPLWKHVISLSLTINMRVQQAQVDDDPILANELAAFSDYLLQIGRGETHDFPGITSPDFVQLDQNMVLPTDSLTPLLNFVFPTFQGANYTRSAILTPKNKDVDRINNVVITELFEGEIIEKYSSDTYINQDEEARFSLEHINDVVYGGIPPHVLKLKIGCPVTLIRNLNPRQGLCNGTRLICNDVQDHVIRATVLTGSHIGDTVFIPRIEFISDDEHCPIQFKRRQFPIKLAFSLTINKAQGQTLDRVGIFLPDHVFSHGQLYVALSRARQASAIKISINRDVSITFNQPDSNPCRYTKNVVYSEVYQSPYTSRQQILQQHTSSTQ